MFEILVNVEEMADSSPVVQVGLALAGRHDAYVTGLHIVGVFPSSMYLPDIMTELVTEEYQARRCDAWWMEQCRKHGLRGAWEVIRGVYVSALARRSCMADITVSRLPPSHPSHLVGMDDVTRVLFSAASPMLLVPPDWDGHFNPERILVAWNSTQESMRALRAALPLLREAGMVRLIDGAQDTLPGIAPPPLPVCDWLVRQGVSLQSIHPFPDASDVGEELLSHAYAMHADMLVMGAWGHSRIGELILGGTTRHVLEHARLPLLLAH